MLAFCQWRSDRRARLVFLRFELEAELLAHHTGKEPAYRMLLPAGALHDAGNGGAARTTQQPQHLRLLGIGSRGLMAHDLAGRRCRLRPHLGCRARLAGPCTFALGHLETPLHRVGAIARRHHANPAEAHWRWRGRGASRSGSVSVTTMHAPFKGEVECKMTSGSTGFCVAHLGVEQPYRDDVRSSLRATSAEIIAASEYATHTSSNTNILKRRDPKQREFTRYFKEIVRARIRQYVRAAKIGATFPKVSGMLPGLCGGIF